MGHKEATVDMIWVDEHLEPVDPFPDSTYCRFEFRPRRHGKSCPGRDGGVIPESMMKFNTEGEKPMAKIDWKKPLRVYPPGERNKDQKVYTYKSGKQRVVWIDDHVYPVDDNGRATATVSYPNTASVLYGEQIVENVPEEKFFLGLARDPDGTYWLTDGGTVSNMGTMNYWKKLMGDQPHWIVDTRKSAEPPKAVAHDPKDWTVVIGWDNSTTSYGMRTLADACAIAKETTDAVKSGDVKVVRVRETPAPADTARYIQLYRRAEQPGPWKIDAVGDRQELRHGQLGLGKGYYEYAHVKVRD